MDAAVEEAVEERVEVMVGVADTWVVAEKEEDGPLCLRQSSRNRSTFMINAIWRPPTIRITRPAQLKRASVGGITPRITSNVCAEPSSRLHSLRL
jgi:hypothetical protein